jgi:hypothetical protein
MSALMHAADLESPELVKELLKINEIDLKLKNTHKQTALEQALLI